MWPQALFAAHYSNVILTMELLLSAWVFPMASIIIVSECFRNKQLTILHFTSASFYTAEPLATFSVLFNVFINDLGNGTESIFVKFSDDTRQGEAVDMLEGRAAIPPQPGGMSKQGPQETQQRQIKSPSPGMEELHVV